MRSFATTTLVFRGFFWFWGCSFRVSPAGPSGTAFLRSSSLPSPSVLHCTHGGPRHSFLFPVSCPSAFPAGRCEGLSTRTLRLLCVLLLVVRRSAATTPANTQRNRTLRSLSLFTGVHFHRGSPARVLRGGWWVSHDGTHGWRCNPAHGTDRIYTTSNPCVRL